MYELLIYSLKTGACLVVFYLFFKLILSRETFHCINRLLLLSAIVASFVLPLCVVTTYHELPEQLPFSTIDLPLDTTTHQAEFPLDWVVFIGLIYLVGCVISFGWTLRSIIQVVSVIRRNSHEKLSDGVILARSPEPIASFSWWRYIVISEDDMRESGSEIMLHEMAHIRLGHSFDILLSDVALALQWFNPSMWLLRRELLDIHEFEADAAVLAAGVNGRDYQLLLIKKAVGERWYSVANSFNHSKLKNRITMMLRKKSSRWAIARTLLVLPLVGLAIGAFAQTVYLVPKDKDSEKVEYQITILVNNNDLIDSVAVQNSQPNQVTPKYNMAVATTSGIHEEDLEANIDNAQSNGNKPNVVNVQQVDSKEYNLLIVNGIPHLYDQFNNILPSDIESISVLKGERGQDLYVDMESNDEVLVATKSDDLQSAKNKWVAVMPDPKITVTIDSLRTSENEGIAIVSNGPTTTMVDTSKGHSYSRILAAVLKDYKFPEEMIFYVNGNKANEADVRAILADKIKSVEEIKGKKGKNRVIKVRTVN